MHGYGSNRLVGSLSGSASATWPILYPDEPRYSRSGSLRFFALDASAIASLAGMRRRRSGWFPEKRYNAPDAATEAPTRGPQCRLPHPRFRRVHAILNYFNEMKFTLADRDKTTRERRTARAREPIRLWSFCSKILASFPPAFFHSLLFLPLWLCTPSRQQRKWLRRRKVVRVLVRRLPPDRSIFPDASRRSRSRGAARQWYQCSDGQECHPIAAVNNWSSFFCGNN